MRIYVAADHGGFELKQKLMQEMQEWDVREDVQGFDLGAYELTPDDDYPPYAFDLAREVVYQNSLGEKSFGILICRSGIGMSIAANKVRGCHAALCFTLEHARKAREHNDANVLVLDADYNNFEEHVDMIIAFLSTQFEGGRHLRRVQMISDFESKR